MKKYLFYCIAAGCLLFNNSTKTMDLNNTSMGKLATTFLAGGVLVTATEWLSKQNSIIKGCNYIGLNANDVKRVLLLSSGCIATSFFTTQEVRDNLIDFAWKAPLIGLVSKLSNTKIAKEVIRNVPFGLGSFLVCSRPHRDEVHKQDEEKFEKIKQSENNPQIKNIPYQSSVETCEGSCHDCQMTSAVRIVIMWTLAKYAVPAAFHYITSKN